MDFYRLQPLLMLLNCFFAGCKDTDDYKVVIFEITVDGPSLKNTVFVDIDKYLGINCDSEILFNIGSTLKIEDVNHNSDIGAWVIKMKATDEGIYEIQETIDAKKREFCTSNIYLMFGRLLLEMNEYTKAQSYFHMMLQVLPKSHEDRASVYDRIGDPNMRTTNCGAAFVNFNLAYATKKKKLT
ncbi:unnamed protein product [Rotaria socialis]|uniref:Tetratricopeptide repeat protein n=1 Tax=Rotaria socialis TaxID=392032 RepID=A0A820AD61_9BILA|nr:unnamed protein product [Rotaria socialis]CAF3389989.1 unnamed protein product [Rotaria socialis]CAF4188653.1 unnamed protein product [Rotaria socialis]CAF4246292.1 unnamed protein product [Rotaria socialis]